MSQTGRAEYDRWGPICPETVRGDTELGQNGRKQNARLVLEDGEEKGKRKGYTGEWVIIETLDTGLNLNNQFKRVKVNWFKHRLQSTKSQRNSAWCSADRYNYPSLGANREFKSENIVQAYPVVVDTFNYK